MGGDAAAYVGLGVVALGGRLERRKYRLPVYDSGPHVVCLEWKGDEAFITGNLDDLNCLLVSNDLSDGQRPGSMYCVKVRLLRPSVGQSLTVYVPLLFPQKLDHRTTCQEISSLERKLGIPVWPGGDQSIMSIHCGVLQLY